METSMKLCVLFFFGYLFIIQTSHGQLNYTFRCISSSGYIPSQYFCDGIKDCPGGEDEGAGCKRKICGKEHFSCDNGTQCKNITVRCDTKQDCNDGSDELNCGDEINVKNCTTDDKFLCHDGLRCLDLEYTCDGRCNCFDCSDENENCWKSDDNLKLKCPSSYFQTADGPKCLCNSRYDQSEMCKYVQYCDAGHNCEQHCTKYKTQEQCSCWFGFQPLLITNVSRTRRCRNRAFHQNLLIYATSKEIKSLNITSKIVSTVQSEVKNCSALSVANDFVYYSTTLPNNTGSIFKSSLQGGKANPVLKTGFPVTSMAVDYFTNNIYFTSNGSISVCKSNGLICWKLKCCGVTYVTVAPKSGLMFYVQANSTYTRNSVRLMKSNMDGSNETILADNLPLGNVSMVVDEPERKIYMWEKNDIAFLVTLRQISMNGEMEESIAANDFRSLDVFNSDIFYTVDRENDIYHAEYFNDFNNLLVPSVHNSLFRDESTPNIKFLCFYDRTFQKHSTIQNPCPSSCNGLCLTKPSPLRLVTSNYTCLCNNFTSTSDNPWCSSPPPAASSGVLVTFISVFVVLSILGAAGYFIFLKRNYYTTMQRWKGNKGEQKIISKDLDEY